LIGCFRVLWSLILQHVPAGVNRDSQGALEERT
jgi:hypothetical protein